MQDNFRNKYKVTKSNIDISNEIQLALRQNEEYDRITDRQCEEIINFFSQCYPEVWIEIPKKRKKTPKSINEKCKNKEIERLSKLYVIEGISNEEIEELYKLIEKRIYEKEELDSDLILKNIRILLQENIKDLNIEQFLDCIMVEEISNSTKKALLRILRGNLEKSDVENKSEQIDLLEKKYGRQAQIKFNNPECNIMQYESIEEIRKNPKRIELLHNKVEYLKSEDLMGMKIIIVKVPSNISTKNKILKQLIQLRDGAKNIEEKEKYDNMVMQEIAREFTKNITNNKQLLKKLSADVIPFSIKHKNKTNGYEAYHSKIRSIDNPQYTLEIQIKSEYVENLARGNGKASHENRPGKKRFIPSTENSQEFIKKIKYMVPEYTLYIKKDDQYKAKKCSMIENIMGYYENLVYPGMELYDEIQEIINEYQTK